MFTSPLLHITTSTRNGPGAATPAAKWRLNSSIFVALAPGTPSDFASVTQSMSGWPRLSMSSAFRPGLPAPTLASSPLRIWYERLENTTVVTSSPSRACVHSACIVYMPLPSPSRQTTLRSGQATAAPVASGRPNPIDPPILLSQSCGAADLVGAKKPRPVVTASSATIAFSGSKAPSEAPSASEVIAPVPGPDGLSLTTGAGVLLAPTASASASSAAIESSLGRDSTCPSQPGGVSTLGLSG